MPTEQIGDYEVEYAGVRVIGGEEWVAQVAIFGHSTNPMHRNPVFPVQRVLPDQTFAGLFDGTVWHGIRMQHG